MKIIIILLLFTCLPIVLRILLKRGVSRKLFAVLTSFLYSILLLLLSVIFISKNSIIIGVIMFLCMMIGGYPTAYLLFPTLYKIVVRNNNQ